MAAILPTEKTSPSTGLGNQIILLYGRPKVGKSTLASKFPNAIFAATEPGLKYMQVHQMQIGSWKEFSEMCFALLNTEHEFKTLVIDTVDLLWNFLCDYICKREGVPHVSDLKFGKGHGMAKDEMQRVLSKVANISTKSGHNMGLVLISHANEIELDKRLVWVPSLSKAPRNMLTGMSDLVCFADIHQSGDGNVSRVLRLAPHPNYMTGGRMCGLPAVIDLDYGEFSEAMQASIEGGNNE